MAPPNAVESARHICQEARVVLTSLRGGPPIVARGELATDLMDLRAIAKAVLSDTVQQHASHKNNVGTAAAASAVNDDDDDDDVRPEYDAGAPWLRSPQAELQEVQQFEHLQQQQQQLLLEQQQDLSSPRNGLEAAMSPPSTGANNHVPSTVIPPLHQDPFDEDGAVFVSQPPTPGAHARPAHPLHRPDVPEAAPWAEDVGPFARPFLAVIVDPRAAGPHTLVALRSLFRLVDKGSLLQPTKAQMDINNYHYPFTVLFESLTKGVLSCKFEQTDAGADEAVEMAIADLLALLVKRNQQSMRPTTLMDAFNTVFVTRNTFVHSPALCYHFEDVLTAIVTSVFSEFHPSATLILEFLVNQLLHTPLVGGDVVDESMREAQMAHAATRLLCLRLVNSALRTGWSQDADDAEEGNVNDECSSNKKDMVITGSPLDMIPMDAASSSSSDNKNSKPPDNRSALAKKAQADELLRIIKDDLCLSLLMTGQAIWAYHDASSNISPGLISLDVLSEICNTLSTLWHTISLRKHLVPQFETIFTGFYQRALVLLRKRTNPVDSITFNADLVFDAEVEVILESLVDLLCLHDFRHSIADGDGGSLESLFATYDCHMSRSDVAAGLMVELCRCCGGCVNEEGEALLTPVNSMMGTPAPTLESGLSTPNSSSADLASIATSTMVPVEPWRPVPPHLKELCAQAIVGAMKCLFRDDKASKETLMERSQRELTIMLSGEELHQDEPEPSSHPTTPTSATNDHVPKDHVIRYIKSKKRLMRQGASLFNQKPSKGIEFLVSAGLFSDPPTPAAVASFLRNAIVVGLNKHAVGAYLGEAGKPRVAGKSPPVWQRDWFHKEVLSAYCGLFRFEGQSLLDGLRMFLSSFRLPGEAQQIDRILQAFSDCCGQVCDESVNGRLKLFSTDVKKASDAAYLLSFSIIMLNTDLHNANIREDRKMSLGDFIKNNSDYGRDITEPGKEFPREFLQGIYESIQEEEIRTEGEGADGCMTIERWKDVLRGSAEDQASLNIALPSEHDAEDLTELVLEHVWIPIMSAIGAFWGISRPESSLYDAGSPKLPSLENPQKSGMLGVQGARLGMDMALEMLDGVLHLRRVDIFRRIFTCVCRFTGLVGEYTADAVDRSFAFANSLESQSGLIVAMRVASSASDDIGTEGWQLVWQMLFELRDLKMLGMDGGAATGANSFMRSVLKESEPDVLSPAARSEWNMWLIKGDVEKKDRRSNASGVSSYLGAFGRVLFGGNDESYEPDDQMNSSFRMGSPSAHGKEDLLLWDDPAPSDDEGEPSLLLRRASDVGSPMKRNSSRSLGAQFENDLIQENVLLNQQTEMPVTGLERVEDTRRRHISPRKRVRNRLARACDFYGLVSESRFMTVKGLEDMLRALLDAIAVKGDGSGGVDGSKAADPLGKVLQPGEVIDLRLAAPPASFPLSPASRTFAEVLVCEIVLGNKDRLGGLWHSMLKSHYAKRLGQVLDALGSRKEVRRELIETGVEKCLTGLLRICAHATSKNEAADEIMSIWTTLIPSTNELPEHSLMGMMDKHVSEGLWRIVRNVDALCQLGDRGWDGLFSLINWCANRGGQLAPVRQDGLVENSSLAEDDPALQAYRSLHLMLNTVEVRGKVPDFVVGTVNLVITAGERRRCSQLSVAGLDLLHNFLEHRGSSMICLRAEGKVDDSVMDAFWQTCWRPAVHAIATAAEYGGTSNVRQHALSMLTDNFLDKRGSSIPSGLLCSVLIEVCIPLTGRRIIDLRAGKANVESVDELMIEFELCIGLVFKPFRHHLNRVVEANGTSAILSMWKSVLLVMEDLLRDEKTGSSSPDGAERNRMIPEDKALTMNELANEHLQNAIMFLISAGLLTGDTESPGEITAATWNSVSRMGFCKTSVGQWKQAAIQGITSS